MPPRERIFPAGNNSATNVFYQKRDNSYQISRHQNGPANSNITSNNSSNTSTEPSRPNNPRKSVSFSLEPPSIRPIDHRLSYSEDEIARLWYSRDQYEKFKESCRKIIAWTAHLRENGRNQSLALLEDDEYLCMRGLEKYTKEGYIEFEQRRNNLLNEMIMFHRIGGACDPDDLARLVRAHSATCVAEARERGRHDQLVALRYFRMDLQHYRHHRDTLITESRKKKTMRALAGETKMLPPRGSNNSTSTSGRVGPPSSPQPPNEVTTKRQATTEPSQATKKSVKTSILSHSRRQLQQLRVLKYQSPQEMQEDFQARHYVLV